MEGSEERPLKIRRLVTAAGYSTSVALDHAPPVELPEGALSPIVVNMSADEDDQQPDDDDDMHSPSASCHQVQDEIQNQSEPKSRNGLKRLRRKQEWEAGRKARKAKRKEKMKEKKVRKARERADKTLNVKADGLSSEGPRRNSHVRQIQVPLTLILDCSFDDLMTEAEMISLGSQLTRSYSDNKTSPYRAHMIISSFGGKMKHRFETVLTSNHLGWKGVKFTDEHFLTAARDADAIMRGLQGGRLAGALAGGADNTHQTMDPPSKVSDSVEAPMTTKSPDHNVDVLLGAGEDDHYGNPPQTQRQVTIDSIKTESDHLAIPMAGEAPSNLQDPSVQSSAAAPKDNPKPIEVASDTPASASVPVPAPAPTPSIIYLTSDSPNTLTHLSPNTSYIIGGLVDKNRHKGLCYKRAMALNIPTAKLPIGEYMTMQSRSVLTTNHVVEIMVRWLEEGDWGKAFLRVIPKRKEAKLKVRGEVRGGEGGAGEEGDGDGVGDGEGS